MIDEQIQGLVDVRRFGAKGDGQSEDTAAVLDAMSTLPESGGVLYFPPGTYLLDTIDVPAETTFMGHSAYTYRTNGGTVLQPVRDDQPCLLNVFNKVGTRFVGLTLDGNGLGTEIHGIKATRPGAIGSECVAESSACSEMNLVVDNCKIHNFSGAGMHMRRVWAWHLRHSLISHNRGGGIDITDCYDAWITDTIFAGNKNGGIRAEILAATIITGCRIEWNVPAGIWVGPDYADSVQISTCLFDADNGPAIDIRGRKCFAVTISGNIFRRSGQFTKPGSDENCHLRLSNIQGLSLTGNSFLGGRVGVYDGGVRNYPDYAMIMERLRDSVITGNALYHGSLVESIRDDGGHENLLMQANAGSLQMDGDLEA